MQVCSSTNIDNNEKYQGQKFANNILVNEITTDHSGITELIFIMVPKILEFRVF